MKLYQYDEFQECDECGVEQAEVISDGAFVCRRCEKALKRQSRKTENAQRRREERQDDLNYRRR